MQRMGLDTTIINKKYDGDNIALIPFEENFSFVNESGKGYYIEYIGYDESCSMHVFDIYPINE